jgi:hypothetical protein
MKEIKDLYDLIKESDFGHKLVEISRSDSEISFRTNNTSCGTYLSGKILFDSNQYIVYNSVGYEDIKIPLSKVEYGIKLKTELIANLSDTLLRLIEFSDFSNKRFNDFEKYSVPSTVDWKQVFMKELTNRFGETKTILQSCGIKLVICFDEHTDLFSVTLKRTELFQENKTLLQENVDGSNYREVLSILDRIHSDFRYRFYDINGIAEQLLDFGY